ncbi:MAG: hypothetical protein IKA57_04820 [Clostridia bacterium]|jgi:hypothetical protein|nr:hypothetical protein [Clostridia bacterium]
MAKKEKRKKIDDLDMETTVADMNVEGFSWYDPNKKAKNNGQPTKLTKKEERALMLGAFRAMLPMIGCILTGMLLMFLLVFLWLK